MASTNYEKIKSPQELKAKVRHCDKEERLKHNHANKEIDKSLTAQNVQSRSYAAACKAFDDRIAFLDAQEGANLRKDRVLAFGLTIPCPSGLDERRELDFYKRVREIVTRQYGSDNIIGDYYHRDEKHFYGVTIETTEGEQVTQLQESLNHAHFYIVPEHNGKLNGKWFSSAAQMRKLNKAIHTMCQTEFGCDFMDGSRKSSKEDVETLKGRSRELELELKEQQLNNRERQLGLRSLSLDSRERFSNSRSKELDKREQMIGNRFRELDKQEQQIGDHAKQLADYMAIGEYLEQQFNEGMKIVSGAYKDIAERQKALGETEQARKTEQEQQKALAEIQAKREQAERAAVILGFKQQVRELRDDEDDDPAMTLK